MNSAKQKLADTKEKYKDASMENVFLFKKVMQTVSAVLLIWSGWGRFFATESLKNWTGFCLTIYFMVFAYVILAMEYQCFNSRARIWFNVLNYCVGKAIFSLWMSLLCFGVGKDMGWIDIMAGIYFLLMTVVYFVMSTMYKDREKPHIDIILA